jgi:hypothetical protein
MISVPARRASKEYLCWLSVVVGMAHSYTADLALRDSFEKNIACGFILCNLRVIMRWRVEVQSLHYLPFSIAIDIHCDRVG